MNAMRVLERVLEHVNTLPNAVPRREQQQHNDLPGAGIAQSADAYRSIADRLDVLSIPTYSVPPRQTDAVGVQKVTTVPITLSSNIPTSSVTTIVTLIQPRMAVQFVNTTNIGQPHVSMAYSSTTTPYSGMPTLVNKEIKRLLYV